VVIVDHINDQVLIAPVGIQIQFIEDRIPTHFIRVYATPKFMSRFLSHFPMRIFPNDSVFFISSVWAVHCGAEPGIVRVILCKNQETYNLKTEYGVIGNCIFAHQLHLHFY